MPIASAIVETKRSVVFDLFHTLTALESIWGQGRPTTCQMLGVSQEAWHRQLLENSWERLVGQQQDPFAIVAGMARAIDPTISDACIRAAVVNRIERFATALVNVPRETCSVLAALKKQGKILGLISNADVMEIAAWNESPMAPLFDAVVFSCDAGCAKPGKGIYQLCLQRLNVTPQDSVFVGDGGSNELQGAREAGMATIMIAGIIRELWPEKIPQRMAQADAVIEDLAQLLDETAQLNKSNG